ncbi:RNase adapter RapZ [Criibacterium bergeronii]|uniref:RNase adapter RapZ n=1 Tax=Criibacterium bergeronii TaxID=1871336 RepID=A0A552V8W4_9FIRM|nr:RNase adapter RapZ [Criibacterium bergeronii]TRW26904.1 RNase adapter RapZ [Criibacterium bergeronii]
MKIVIITGMSGSGKSEAMNVMEDMGYYCIDNLPPEIIPKMVTLSADSKGTLNKIALGVDIRGYQFLEEINNALNFLEESGFDYQIIFLESSDETIVKRYKMSRRRHPLSNGDDILQGIFKEKTLLADIRKKADYIVDTSNFLPIDLRGEIMSLFNDDIKNKELMITIVSFGFKYGIPIDADLVFDVRFMPNPYYVIEMRHHTGNDQDVQDYVMNNENSIEFIKKLEDMLDFLIPMYIKEGKNHLVIAIGCTGGRHRSVTVSNLIYSYLLKQKYSVFLKHRDIKN